MTDILDGARGSVTITTVTTPANVTNSVTREIIQVSSVNIGMGSGLYDGLDDSGALRFKTLTAGAGINVTELDSTVQISVDYATHGLLSLFSLAEFASNAGIVRNGILYGSSGTTHFDFLAPPTVSGSLLSYNGTTLAWTSPQSFASGTGLGLSHATIDGVIQNTFALTTTTVTPGTYNLASITVDAYGRIISASDNSSLFDINTASNLGSGYGVFYQKTGSNLSFKSLIPGNGIELTGTGTDITIFVASSLSPGVYGGGRTIPVLTVDPGGLITAIDTIGITQASSTQYGLVRFATNSELSARTGGLAVSSDGFPLALAAYGSTSLPLAAGIAAIGGSGLFARQDHVHPYDSTRAPLVSPAFTGVPTAPTAPVGTNTTQLATTAYVLASVSTTGIVPSNSLPSINGGSGAIGASNNYARADHAHPQNPNLYVDVQLTGTPSAPTATVGTNTSQIATTAFVIANSAAAMAGSNTPLMDGVATAGTSPSVSHQDHVHPSDTTKASLTGATFSGNISINSPSAHMVINKPGSGTSTYILSETNNVARWFLEMGNSNPETGSNAGSDLVLSRFNDAGLFLDSPISIARSTGITTFATAPRSPTPNPGDNSTRSATTAFVVTALMASPILGGIPTAPTAAIGTNTTQVATTAFVLANSSTGGGGVSKQSFVTDSSVGDTFMSHARWGVQNGPTLNAFIGSVIQDGSNGSTPPSGIMGYAALRSDGAGARAGFFRADVYSNGCATTEFNSFNYKGSVASVYPPDRSFGAAGPMPITVTVAAGGTYPSFCGIQICKEGSAPQQYLTGIYTSADAIYSNGIFIDSDATNGPSQSALFKNTGATASNTAIGLQVTGLTPHASASLIRAYDHAGGELFGINASGSVAIGALNPVASAALDINSTTKGLLPPRMTTAQKNAIVSPAEGLMVFDSDLGAIATYHGGAWRNLFSDGTGNLNQSFLNLASGLSWRATNINRGIGASDSGPNIPFNATASGFNFWSDDTTTNTGIKTTASFIRNVSGSGTFGPAYADMAAIFGTQKHDYLNTTAEGELDTVVIVNRQGRKGDALCIGFDIQKTRTGSGDTGGVGGMEGSVQWVDQTGTVAQRQHMIIGFGESTGGESSGKGFGYYSESRAGVWYSAYAVGTYDEIGASTHGYNYAITATTSRMAANSYFKVVGDTPLVGRPGDIVQGTSTNAITLHTDGSAGWAILDSIGSQLIAVKSGGNLAVTAGVGFNGATPLAKPTITGSRGSNAAVASLLTALAAYGLIIDSTTP
jgi:hypothetical protein